MAALALGWCMPVGATEYGREQTDHTTVVAGQHLKLNGAGTGRKLAFKVYAISLYLPERRRTTQEILRLEGARRVAIRLLRDVDTRQFSEAVSRGASDIEVTGDRARILASLTRLGEALAGSGEVLHKGDVVTLDWVPDVGVILTLNQRQLAPAVRDLDVYNSLLKIWIGENPTDVGLKVRLLGLEA